MYRNPGLDIHTAYKIVKHERDIPLLYGDRLTHAKGGPVTISYLK